MLLYVEFLIMTRQYYCQILLKWQCISLYTYLFIFSVSAFRKGIPKPRICAYRILSTELSDWQWKKLAQQLSTGSTEHEAYKSSQSKLNSKLKF